MDSLEKDFCEKDFCEEDFCEQHFAFAPHTSAMGNELSHRRYCRRFRRFERLPAEEGTAVPDVPDVPTAQPAQGEGSGGSGSPPEKKELPAAGQGRSRAMALCSSHVAWAVLRGSGLQEAGDDLPATNPDGKTPALSQGRAEAAGGHTEVTTGDLPVQPAVGMAEEDAKQGTVKSSSGSHRRASSTQCRASPLCRWLRNLRSPAGKPKAKPGAASSQE